MLNIYIYKMQHLEVSGAVRRIYKSLGFKGLKNKLKKLEMYLPALVL